MKRFQVLYGDGKCSIREMPGTFKCESDGLETELVMAVKKFFSCEVKQVGIPATHVETNLPDDYEQCGDCGLDHAYDVPFTDVHP